MVLYGCEVWGSSTSTSKLRQIERLQKHLITNSLKIKSSIPYKIILAEAGAIPIEASAMFRLLSYLRRLENMEIYRWPKIATKEKLDGRKSTWMKQNIKWMNKWDIGTRDYPNNNRGIKKYVQEKFKKSIWTRQLRRKKDYYIKHFNPTHDHMQKNYIGMEIKWKEKILIVLIRTSSHQLRCETGRWMTPKKEWADRRCRYCTQGVVEREWHYIMECAPYKNIWITYI